ncbi:ATP-grasp domain-containing protein [Pararhodonellum marinum]|uniref:ATP-grasp domain-containing protein n=1 Tax=Pararhodonellum marinum TaxID=2755358 RepID=UPI00188E4AAF|nr:ATP-grasp domain-containing protein [Pararhodonellum marinum]
MENQSVAIVLGGTYPHKSLINKLKERDYHTILIDFLENAPALINSDEHIRESTLDKEKVLEISKDKHADLVISACIDQANVTACYVAEHMKLFSPYSFKTALLVSNKTLMKKVLIENNIPTAKFKTFESIEAIDDLELSFPLIVKPSDSNSSKGVRKVDNSAELLNAANIAFKISRDGKFLIEEYIEGKEIGVDCVIKNDDVQIIMTRERRKILSDEKDVQQIIGSYWPADIDQHVSKKAREIAIKIKDAFGLNNTMFFMQAIVRGDEIFVIEFAPRVGGGENYKIIEMLTGVDVLNVSIQSFLGEPINYTYQSPQTKCADIYLYAYPGILDSIVGLEELQENKIIDSYSLFKNRNYQITSEMASGNRLGSFIVSGETFSELDSKIETAISKIKILDDKNEDITKRSIYIQ